MTDTSTAQPNQASAQAATTEPVLTLSTDGHDATLNLPTDNPTMSAPAPTLSTAPSALDEVVRFYETVFSAPLGETPAQKAAVYATIEHSFAKGYTYNGNPFTPEQLIAYRESLVDQYPQMEFRVSSATEADVSLEPPTVGSAVAIAWRIDAVDTANVHWFLNGMSILLVEDGLAVTNMQYGDAKKGWRKA